MPQRGNYHDAATRTDHLWAKLLAGQSHPRHHIKNRALQKRVEAQGLRGITSNPAIFNKAISSSKDYDEQIAHLVRQDRSIEDIYEQLVVTDVRDACDILRPVYDTSRGGDGFVSLEVSPYLAHDTAGTMQEARRLFQAVNRSNAFIKIPGTPAGVPAIEEMLYEGININITLLFSIQSYEAVAQAYIKAMERRVAKGKPVQNVASVASFSSAASTCWSISSSDIVSRRLCRRGRHHARAAPR